MKDPVYIPIEKIYAVDLWLLDRIDSEIIQDLVNHPSDLLSLGPVQVSHYKDGYAINDGINRFLAAKLLKLPHIQVAIEEVP